MASTRIADFDTWKPGYGLASVSVLQANTTALAPIFFDQALTQAAPNPQTLIQMVESGIDYGKWAAPIYCGVPFELQINSVDRTGIESPALTTLVGADASEATVIPTGADQAGNLDDILARRIDVRDYGTFLPAGNANASAITNTNSLTAAIAAAGAGGAGFVEIPAGTYQFTSLTLPAGVVLRGAGRLGTILQSTQSNKVVTLAGDTAGFERLTLDGVSQVAGSIGVFAANVDFTHFDDVQIQRFDICLQRYGGLGSHWKDLFISDFSTAGYQPHGYSDNGNGGPILEEYWDGGMIELGGGAAIGLDLQYVDKTCSQMFFSRVGFDSNVGTAVQILGGQQIKFGDGCWWQLNTVNVLIDDAGSVQTSLQTTNGIEFEDCTFGPAIAAVPASGSIAASPAVNSTITLNNTLADVAFRRCEISNVSINLNSPGNLVLAQDCDEITGVTLGGNTPTAWLRSQTFDHGATEGLTTGNGATTAWEIEPAPGEYVYLEAKVIGRCRNTTDYGFWHIAVSAYRPGSTLAYGALTAGFTPGNILTGKTSGATARITANSVSGQTGTLTLQDIDGTFLNNELITDSGTGSANAVGTTVGQNAALAGSVTEIRSPQSTDTNWSATFAVTGFQVQVHVTGDTNMNVEWQIDVDKVSLGG